MKIDADTKIIGRFHSKPSPRGLNIYNPLFEELGINAVYLLFYNPDPKVLFDGFRNLNLAGALTAGFESNPKLMELVDECEDMSKYLNAIAHVVNENGVLKGYTHGGEAICKTIQSASKIAGKKLVIVGSGKIAKGLLFYLSKSKIRPVSVEVYNRTPEKAKALRAEYTFITKTGGLGDLVSAEGDILANLSDVGGKAEDIIFTKDIVKNYQAIVDITFETENTNLIQLAKKANKQFATGWDMFTFQGQIALENILKTKIPFSVLKKHVRLGLTAETH